MKYFSTSGENENGVHSIPAMFFPIEKRDNLNEARKRMICGGILWIALELSVITYLFMFFALQGKGDTWPKFAQGEWVNIWVIFRQSPEIGKIVRRPFFSPNSITVSNICEEFTDYRHPVFSMSIYWDTRKQLFCSWELL